MSQAATFDKADPATGEVIGQYKNFSQAEVFDCVDAAHLASNRWQEFGFMARKKTLLKWASFITKNQKRLRN